MDRLKIAIQEIYIAKQIIDASHGSFIKRILSRMIVLRMHNLIGDQIFYQTNKSVNAGNITDRNTMKGNLNALRDLYNEFFQEQRHKFSGHFQDLPLLERIELWSQIDFTTANFFYENPIELYSHFSTAANYESIAVLFPGFNQTEIDLIEKVCQKHDLEGQPTMSSDILNFTRNNSGGIVSSTPVQNQCGALNALELIINFEWDLYEAVKTNKKAADLVKKMLLVDIVNYADNFFTRQDVGPGDPQYFIGLDGLMGSSFKSANEIIKEFKDSYKLQKNLTDLRLVNKFGSHIDSVLPMSDLQTQLDNLDIGVLKRFYTILSNLLEKVYRSEIRLRMYIVKNEVIRDAVSIQGIGAKLFSPQDFTEAKKVAITKPNYNDEVLYEQTLSILEADPVNQDALSFLINAITGSDKISRERIEVKSSPNSSSFNYFELRKTQKYLIDLLNDPAINGKRKKTILNSLLQFGTCSETINIVLQTYSANTANVVLNKKYIKFFGDKIHERDIKIFEFLKKASSSTDICLKYESILSLFKIDVSTRVRVIGQENKEETEQSTFIKETINKIQDPFHRIAYVTCLASELSNDNRLAHVLRHVKEIYLEPFYSILDEAVDEMIVAVGSPALPPDEKNKIMEYFRKQNYPASLGKLADHFFNNGISKAANLIYFIFINGHVIINWEHEPSIVNLGIFHFRGGEKKIGIELMEWLIERNPQMLDLYGPYLILLKDYNRLKLNSVINYLKENYDLDPGTIKELDEL